MFKWLLPAAMVLAPVGAYADGERPVDYLRDIKPVLMRRCAACHGALRQEHGLRIDTAALMMEGGDAGPAIERGASGESLLISAVEGANGVKRMPPEGDLLKAEEIALLRRWIDAGAPAPADEQPQSDPRRHWSFVPPVRPQVPQPSAAAWRDNPIDAFIAVEHEKRGLVAVAEADRGALLRRLSLDLTGLPPTVAELDAFLSDASPNAYEKQVERLLESPHYGTRWGRHWMDVWRYSDWDGYGAEVRESQPHLWRWRDWIIESLNGDRPYDQMVREMLAGDELAPDDPQTLRATGFLARNWYRFNRNVWLDNTVEHTGKAFLGLTMNCARCHDHMYDPLIQRDYYSLRAFFEPYDVRADYVPGNLDLTQNGLARVYDRAADPTYVFTRGDEKRPELDRPVTPGVPAWLGGEAPAITPVTLPRVARYPGSQTFVHELALDQARTAVAKSKTAVEAAQRQAADSLAQLQAVLAREPEQADPPTPELTFEDSLKNRDEKLWVHGAGTWKYAHTLIQTDPADTVCATTSQVAHPRNFLAELKFKTTGGDVYKSVGLSFDLVDLANFRSVYVSGGGELAILFRDQGTDNYPPGRKGVGAEINREHTLQIAVRDALVNVWLDGTLHLAFELPGERPVDGKFAFWTYDATAEFLGVRVEKLAPSRSLVKTVGEKPVVDTVDGAKQAVDAAERSLRRTDLEQVVTLGEQSAVELRIAADVAEVAGGEPAAAAARAAVRAERELAVLRAELQGFNAETQLRLAAAAAQASPENSDLRTKHESAQTAYTAALKAVEAAKLAVDQPAENYTRFGPVYPDTSTGRRLALARWIVDRQNPLAARVAVNHVWLRHFGSPLVGSVFDFGLNGQKPSHPELLDWLAVEFMEGGWRMKALHRLIVTSKTYRLASTGPRETLAVNRASDPNNTLLWRANVRRMEAEAVRDSLLHVAGALDATPAGPDLDPAQGLTVYRRSVYFRSAKEKKVQFLALFDSPNPTECYRRTESIAPQQALAMANSPLTVTMARRLAAQLTTQTSNPADPKPDSPPEASPETVSDTAFVAAAFRTVLTRLPTPDERDRCLEFLHQQAHRLATPNALTPFPAAAGPVETPPAADPRQRARESLVHVLLNHNDFVTVR